MNIEKETKTSEDPNLEVTIVPEEKPKEEVVDEPEKVYTTKEKCLAWDSIQPERIAGKFYEYHSKNLTKMFKALKETKFNADDLIHYQSLLPVREIDEEYEYYVIRRRFCQHLEKYKHHVRSFILYSKMEEMVKQNKEKKDGDESLTPKPQKVIDINLNEK